MEQGPINISVTDLPRLRELLGALNARYLSVRPDLQVLKTRLAKAVVVANEEVPNDVITVDSEVCLSDSRTGAEICCSIVYPDSAEAAAGRISVLAPLGVALLGRRAGEQVSFDAPEGPRSCRILNVQHGPHLGS